MFWSGEGNRSVRHPTFGYGVTIDAEGDGEHAKVQVNFGDQGLRWLLLSMAKLEGV
jgi:DNA helicase-2/ATP-dependent DNA helicase PcrA